MDNNIEDGIIGCILVEPNSLYEIYDKITPDMFNTTFCKRVYETALSLYDRGIKFDATILANEMANSESGPEVYLNQFSNMIMNCPGSWLIKEYTNKLIANYQSKRLNLLLQNIDTNPTTIKDTIGTLMTRLEEIQTNTKERSESLSEIVTENEGNYFVDKPRKDALQVKIGLDKLDECVSFVKGDVIVIAARPSVGKSALATQIAKAVGKCGFKVGYFNMEMVKSQIYERLIASESGIELERIKQAKCFLGDEEQRFKSANERLKRMNIIVSSDAKTDMDIKAECRHQNFDLIIIDYLQMIEYHERCESKRIEIGKLSRAFKLLAKELDVPVVVLSQLNRRSEGTPDKEPTMADIKESGDVEQDASTIILMWNLSDDFRNFKGLKVDKNRQGKLVSLPLEFDGNYMKFEAIKGKTIEDIKTKINEFKPISASDDLPFN